VTVQQRPAIPLAGPSPNDRTGVDLFWDSSPGVRSAFFAHPQAREPRCHVTGTPDCHASRSARLIAAPTGPQQSQRHVLQPIHWPHSTCRAKRKSLRRRTCLDHLTQLRISQSPLTETVELVGVAAGKDKPVRLTIQQYLTTHLS
jgi:hypothetical protein